MVILASCGSNEATPEPGEYQQSMKITALELAGVEGDAKVEMIRQMEEAGNSIGSKFCMSAEQGESQWKEAASQMTRLLGGDCETIRDGGSANVLDLEMKCTGAAQGNVSVAAAPGQMDMRVRSPLILKSRIVVKPTSWRWILGQRGLEIVKDSQSGFSNNYAIYTLIKGQENSPD